MLTVIARRISFTKQKIGKLFNFCVCVHLLFFDRIEQTVLVLLLPNLVESLRWLNECWFH